MPGKFRRHDLIRRHAPPECPFQCASLGLLDAERVAVDLLDELLSLQSNYTTDLIMFLNKLSACFPPRNLRSNPGISI
jgi:hypothetical protein